MGAIIVNHNRIYGSMTLMSWKRPKLSLSISVYHMGGFMIDSVKECLKKKICLHYKAWNGIIEW